MQIHDCVALVTGGTMGIGAAVVNRLAKRGAHVAIAARNLSAEATAIAEQVRTVGRRCELISADLSKPEDCGACVTQALQQFGRLDILVLNAGGPAPGRIEDVSPEDWRYAMDVHVNANFYLARAALPHLRQAPAAVIITMASVAGLRGVPGIVTYCTAKGAVVQFTRALALDLADDNIRVNGVAPGIIRTRFHDGMSEERKRYNLEHRVPLHREGTPEQVADVVELLVMNDYITGEIYTIDGGLTMRIA